LREVLAELPEEQRITFGSGPQLGLAMDEYADEHGTGDYLIRAVIGIDEQRESVAVGDVLDVGRSVRFQLRDAAAAQADLKRRLIPAADARGALTSPW
jgi:small ligand-binding sensory domain FIST